MDETEWVFIRAHHRLSNAARFVKLEYETIARGRDRVIEREISYSGVWIWKPDADNILRLQGLASCRGQDKKIDKPFFVCQAPKKALKVRPVGPPEKEG